jgi:hypothetical protein
MVRWLAKATELLRRREPPAPQPFDLGCACGNRVSGVRQPDFQALICHRCGNLVFVLPIDVYPKPKPKKSVKKPVESAVTQDRTTVRAAVEAEVAVPKTAKAPSATRAAAASSRGVSPTPSPSLREELSGTHPTLTPASGRLFSRFRLVVLAITAVIAITGYFVWQRHLTDVAGASLREHLESGDAAFRQGNFPEAAEDYRQAALAVDRLGRRDAESLGIRQKARELDALVKLSKVALYEFCDQVRESAGANDAKWSETFNERCRNSWVVIEGDIVQENGPDGVPQAILRYPFPIDTAPVIFDARLKVLEPLASTDGPHRVIFAAQLASMAKEGKTNPAWVIRFNDATAFLWAGTDTYRALGPDADDPHAAEETRHLLDHQAKLLGIEKTTGSKP